MPRGIYVRTEEHKKRFRGECNGMFGKKRSDEYKRKLRLDIQNLYNSL